MPEQGYIQEIAQIWEAVKESFREKLSESTTDLWFGEVKPISFEKNDPSVKGPEYLLTLGVPSEFKLDIIRKKYLEDIRNEFSSLMGFPVEISLSFTGSPTAADRISSVKASAEPPKKDPIRPGQSRLPNYNFEYTFENFIVGSTNKFAQAACVAVASAPASNYNPLFIYGNSGLGKTHLMYATINRMKQNNPNIKIIYTKGEDFTNEMISALANNTIQDFRDVYRKCDVLLIDDIQFIAGKNATQEEFFHTFNALFEDKKQIILTSDRPPHEIKTLEDRLVSRFEWGLLADIEPPDLELRIAITKKKAEQISVNIPDDVLTFLGENLRSNIRQIEGAVKKLGALSFLQGKEITLELAHECINELLGGAEPVSTTVEKIFAAVFRKYQISKEDLVSTKRNKEIASARHIAVYLIREMTEMSYPNIAKIFDRDHSTIITSCNRIEGMMQNDAIFSLEINDLKKEISG